MDKQMIIVLGAGALMSFILLYILLNIIDKRLRRKNAENVYIKKSRSYKMNKLFTLYNFLRAFAPTKKYIAKITLRYEILFPGDKKEITKRTIMLALSIWFICCGIIIFMFARQPSPYTFTITLFLIYVINGELINWQVRRTESRLLKQMDKFLSDVRHFYYVKEAVDEAVLEAMEHTGREMLAHATRIHEILKSQNINDEVEKYNATSHNNFLKMFLAQCVSVINYDDKIIGNESLFLRNIKNLKIDINIERQKANAINFKFAGLVAICVAPSLCLDLIKNWAIENLSGIETFYNSTSGILIMVCTIISSVIGYSLINSLRETKNLIQTDYHYLNKIADIGFIKRILDNYENKKYGAMERQRDMLKRMGETITPRQLLVKRFIFGLLTFIIGICFTIGLHGMMRTNISTVVLNADQLTTAANQSQIAKMETVIIDYLSKYKSTPGLTVDKINNQLVADQLFNNKLIREATAKEIMIRIARYQNEYLKWYEVLIIIAISIIAFWMPYWMILFRKAVMNMNMQDEIIQFQSIILMLMYIERMSVLDILVFMEQFAVVFRESIRDCINEYDYGELEALENLKQKETFELFRRLVDSLIISDKIGLENAFDEIAVDRTNYTEQRKLENEMSITNKVTLAQLFSYIPLAMAIGFYLIVPFIIESMAQLGEFSGEFKAL